jgi:uncharacterized protein YndB with AHSA1/START domain
VSSEVAKDILPIVRLRVKFNKTVDEVWEQFINPLVMIQWLGNEIRADLKVGGTIRFLGENAPHTAQMELADHWVIKRITEKRAILFGWTILGTETLFIVRFRPLEDGSVIEVKHGAIPADARGFYLTDHWNMLLANFKAVVELGEPAVRFNYSEYHPTRVTRYDPKEVRISIFIRAPRMLPFDVWTNPEKLKRFIRAEKPKIDAQYAGIYTWWAEGKGPVVFTKMDQERELEFSWFYTEGYETRVNVRFDEVDDDTLVTLHHHGFKAPEDVVGYDIGWASILSELKLFCELGDSGISKPESWSD